jgi:glycosyltransferase involved in cell wall biosynthesis
MLRLGIVIDTLGTGGAEAMLAEFLAVAPDYGIDASVAYLVGDGDTLAPRLRRLGVEPRLLEIKSLLGRRDRALVREHLRGSRPDLVHTHLGYADFLGGLGARALGLPALSTLHSAEWALTPRDRVKDRIMALARRRSAARVIAVSDAARSRYVGRRWDRPERVVVIRNGVRGASPAMGRAEARAELGLGSDGEVIAMVGRLRAGKGHHVAVAATAILRSRGRPVRLVVIGEGEEREAVERMAAPLGEGVVMAGFRDDIPALLPGIDVVVHPSEHDALPTALIEAMAASVPVVATAVGGIPEIVEDGVTGILVAPGPTAESVADALESLLADPGRMRDFGRAGRARFEAEFTIGRWMKRLVSLYEEVLAARSSSYSASTRAT